jgi:hypothetical protein
MNFDYVISEFFKYLLNMARPSIIILWQITVRYGLNPKYSYLQFINPGTPFLNFYNYLFNSIYTYMIMAIITLAAASALVYNSFVKPYPSIRLIMRIFVAIFLFEASYRISIILLKLSYAFYIPIYDLKPSWSNIEISGLSLKNTLISILFNGSFALAIFMLFGILIVRQALIIFFIILLPVASLMFIIPGSEKHVIRFFRIFFEIAFFPFFTIIIVYIIGITNNPFMEIGLIYVAGMAPVFFVTEIYRFFQGAMNFMDTDSVLTGMSVPLFSTDPESILNNSSEFSSTFSGMSEDAIPGIIDSNGDIH